MIEYLYRKIRLWLLPNHSCQRNIQEADPQAEYLTGSVIADTERIRQELIDAPGLMIREFLITPQQKKAVLIFMEGLVQQAEVKRIINLLNDFQDSDESQEQRQLFEKLQTKLAIGNSGLKSTVSELVEGILDGNSLVLAEECSEALILNTWGEAARPISEPINEVVLSGPREGFVESLRTNISLLQRKINNPDLVFSTFKIGKQTRTGIGIAYLKGTASHKLVEEVRRRLKRIEADWVLGSQDIAEFIADNPFSPYRTAAYSERPEVVAAKILEGRVAIFIAGTPVVLTVPMLFVESFQNPNDYGFQFYYGTLLRWLRFLAYFISVFSPALYVALLSFNQELLPAPLLITLVSVTQMDPFSVITEALIIGVVVEILRMGLGLAPRLGREVVAVITLLLFGQVLITSGLVTAPFIAVVAITLFASYATPFQEEASAFIRLFLVILAGISGLFGIVIGSFVVLMHLISLRSFGTPYLAPVTPLNVQGLRDAFIRAPAWMVYRRTWVTTAGTERLPLESPSERDQEEEG